MMCMACRIPKVEIDGLVWLLPGGGGRECHIG